MMAFLKKLHKWVALLIGIQLLLWLLSGLLMSLLEPAKVSGEQWARQAGPKAGTLHHGNLLEPQELPAEQLKDALSISLDINQDQPLYRITRVDDVTLINATNGQTISIDQQHAKQLATRDFTGEGEIISIESGTAPDMETRNSRGEYWRVNFSDKTHTSLYISVSTGEILARRNSYWRVFDFFWMLHIMDYSGHEDINNTLIITVALIAIWLGISGFILLFGSFKRHDFHFLSIWRKRDDVVVTLIDPALSSPQQLRLKKDSNLFLSLANKHIKLPSICGGGGECGRCGVQIEAANLPVPTQAEKHLIAGDLLKQGYRLACQQQIKNNISVRLAAGALAGIKLFEGQ